MRPGIDIPQWATDSTYMDPGNPWDTAPNKVIPPGSIQAQGYRPLNRPPAEFLNWYQNVIGAHLAHQDAIEAQNWTAIPQVAGLLAPSGVSFPGAVWNPLEARMWAFGNDVAYSHNGFDWTNSGLFVPALYSGAANTANGMTVACGPAVALVYSHVLGDPVGTWGNTTPAGSTGIFTSIYDADQNLFVFGGLSSGGTHRPHIWVGAADMSTLTDIACQNQGGYEGGFGHIAVAPGRKVAFAPTVNPNVFSDHFWTVSDVTQPWTDQGALSGQMTSRPCALVYDAARDLFVAACILGEIYTSKTGITWTQVAGSSGARHFVPNCFAVNGSMWVGAVTVGSVRNIVWTVNEGTTWGAIPWPWPLTETGACLQMVDDRFLFMSTGGLGAYTLRLR